MKTMQKITILFCIILTGFIVGCDYIEENKPDIFKEDEVVTPDNATLEAEKLKAEEQQKLFAETLQEIENNLREITRREGIILSPAGEVQKSTSDKVNILKNIEAINKLVIDNREKIAYLNEQIRKTKFDKTKMNNQLVEAEEKVREYEEQVGDLKRQLAESDYRYAAIIKQIDAVAAANESLVKTLDWYDEELNTAYYTEGSASELRKTGIVAKKGDWLGLGGAKVLNSDLEPTNFTRIDVREATVIPVNAKKAKLVTGHERGSYEFVKDEDNMIASLNIIDPEEFWKSSKYLVVETR